MRLTELRRGFPSRSQGHRLPIVIGRGVIPGGSRFVVVQTPLAWPKGAAVQLLHGDAKQPSVLPNEGQVWGSIGRNLVRVAVRSVEDARLADFARLCDEADEPEPEPWRETITWLNGR